MDWTIGPYYQFTQTGNLFLQTKLDPFDETRLTGEWGRNGNGSPGSFSPAFYGLEVERNIDLDGDGAIGETSTPNPPPLQPTYRVTPSAGVINEGESIITTIETTNVAQGTALYWAVDPNSNLTINDLSVGAMSGSGTINANGSFIINHTLRNDQLTEGTESFAVILYADPNLTQEIARSVAVRVLDTSLTPAAPTYQIDIPTVDIHEGGNYLIAIRTTNVAQGTQLWWEITGENLTQEDLPPGGSQGSGIIDANGNFGFIFTPTIDNIPEEGPLGVCGKTA